MDDDTAQGLIILILVVAAISLSYIGARAWQQRATEPVNIEFEDSAINPLRSQNNRTIGNLYPYILKNLQF